MNKILLEYINRNKKEFIKLICFILVGIIIGVIFNKLFLNYNEREELKEFILNIHDLLKQNENIDYNLLLRQSLKNNITQILIIGVLGFFIFGNICIYCILLYKGFILGFTIATSLSAYLFGLNFFVMMMALVIQNIIMIPILLILSEKSSKIYKNIIMKKVTLKEELCKQIIIMLIFILLGIVSSLIEIYISMNFLIAF